MANSAKGISCKSAWTRRSTISRSRASRPFTEANWWKNRRKFFPFLAQRGHTPAGLNDRSLTFAFANRRAGSGGESRTEIHGGAGQQIGGAADRMLQRHRAVTDGKISRQTFLLRS